MAEGQQSWSWTGGPAEPPETHRRKMLEVINRLATQDVCICSAAVYLHEVGVLSQDGPCDLLVVLQQVV